MPSDTPSSPSSTPIDAGLLSPVTAGFDDATSDAAILADLVAVEIALARAWEAVGTAPAEAVAAIEAALSDAASGATPAGTEDLSVSAVAHAARAGGNPVIPLVGALRTAVGGEAAAWVHRGATSQDVLDTALVRTAHRTGGRILADLASAGRILGAFAAEHRDEVAVARTLTQHAVPTTIGLRAAVWLRGVRRAESRLREAVRELPVQLGGAAGTLASFVEIGGAEAAAALPAAFAAELGLPAPDAPWHTTRWPVTELGDALVQVDDALGVIAADVATLSRTEIGELAEGSGGGSSAMPQKRNPAASVLIRSAAIRAPHLGATLHTAAALAVDERPDGAWHAEWPALRELLRLTSGAAGTAVDLLSGLRVDRAAVARNLALTGEDVLAERRALAAGDPLDPGDPAAYTGLAGALVDDAIAEAGES